MTTLTHANAIGHNTPDAKPHTSGNVNISQQVRTLLDSRNRCAKNDERRQYVRHPFPYLIRIQPVDDEGLTPCGQPIVVVGKQLSEKGIDFYHKSPLPFRRVIASLQTRSGDWLSFLVDLTWCRFNELGWYNNGGRFLKAVDWR